MAGRGKEGEGRRGAGRRNSKEREEEGRSRAYRGRTAGAGGTAGGQVASRAAFDIGHALHDQDPPGARVHPVRLHPAQARLAEPEGGRAVGAPGPLPGLAGLARVPVGRGEVLRPVGEDEEVGAPGVLFDL